jgi:hypothetical protein
VFFSAERRSAAEALRGPIPAYSDTAPDREAIEAPSTGFRHPKLSTEKYSTGEAPSHLPLTQLDYTPSLEVNEATYGRFRAPPESDYMLPITFRTGGPNQIISSPLCSTPLPEAEKSKISDARPHPKYNNNSNNRSEEEILPGI